MEINMQIAVASGKGGTGKTLVSTCLLRILGDENSALIDSDVEEPNAGLVLMASAPETANVSRLVPEIDYNYCNFCGRCAEVCNFNALLVLNEKVLLFHELCHSCGACAYFCPLAAIKEKEHPIGVIEEAHLPGHGRVLAGRLNIGEAQSPLLINAVKKQGDSAALRIIDCPPGTTCAMIESIRDSDYCLLVTEPTPFGLHDLELSLEAMAMLGIPGGLVINRWQGEDGELATLSSQTGVPILGRIPFSVQLAQAYMQGQDPLEAMPALRDILSGVFMQIKGALS
jgi:MinD superfamily P-loop ATPase